MKYNKLLTKIHPKVLQFPLLIRDINDIFIDEGCKLKDLSPFFGKGIVAIDGDKLEEEVSNALGRLNKNSSVDIIIVSANDTIENMIFIELKLRTKQNFYHLDKMSLRKKVDESKLAIGIHTPILKKYFIVFDKSVINQAANFFFSTKS